MDGVSISVITIGLTDTKISDVRHRVKRQTYSNVEVVGSTKGGIPTAWNHSISKASGELYVFTETDAVPIHSDWLERIAIDYDLPERRVTHYGEVGRPGHGYDLSNLAVPADVINEYMFDETYPIVEDTELFTRMNKAGVRFEKRYDNPVYHHPAPDRQKDRAFQRGFYQTRCRLIHGQLGVTDEERHIPGGLETNTNISQSSSIVEITARQLLSPINSAYTDLKFSAGSAFAAIRHYI